MLIFRYVCQWNINGDTTEMFINPGAGENIFFRWADGSSGLQASQSAYLPRCLHSSPAILRSPVILETLFKYFSHQFQRYARFVDWGWAEVVNRVVNSWYHKRAPSSVIKKNRSQKQTPKHKSHFQILIYCVFDIRCARIYRYRDDYKDMCELIEGWSMHSLADFLWAQLAVQTRIFTVSIGGKRTQAMVPVADMLNHKRPSETFWTFDDSRDMFTITSRQRYSAGAAVYDSYGHKCNSRYLLDYGFIYPQVPSHLNHSRSRCLIWNLIEIALIAIN